MKYNIVNDIFIVYYSCLLTFHGLSPLGCISWVVFEFHLVVEKYFSFIFFENNLFSGKLPFKCSNNA